jgi:hypothetical protein
MGNFVSASMNMLIPMLPALVKDVQGLDDVRYEGKRLNSSLNKLTSPESTDVKQ